MFTYLGYITLFSLSTSLSLEFAIVISMHDDRGTRVDFAFRCYIHFCTHFPNPFVLAAAATKLSFSSSRQANFTGYILGTGSSLVLSLHTFRISTLLGLKARFTIFRQRKERLKKFKYCISNHIFKSSIFTEDNFVGARIIHSLLFCILTKLSSKDRRHAGHQLTPKTGLFFPSIENSENF